MRAVAGSFVPDMFDLDPPRQKGMNTVEACEGIPQGTVKAFVGLGGNFVRTIPETAAMEAAWKRMRLTVQIATTLNRSHGGTERDAGERRR